MAMTRVIDGATCNHLAAVSFGPQIAGAYPSMVADAEVVCVMAEIIAKLNLGPFTVKLSHRKLLSAMTELAGVPPEKFKPICSAIDKLDKEPW